jgi:hypothetical protein
MMRSSLAGWRTFPARLRRFAIGLLDLIILADGSPKSDSVEVSIPLIGMDTRRGPSRRIACSNHDP